MTKIAVWYSLEGDSVLQINEAFYRLQGKDMFVHKTHSHNEIELIHVISGSGTVIKNDLKFELKSQHIYIIDARKAHIVFPQPEDCVSYVRNKLVIDADSFEQFFRSIGVYDLVESLFCGAPISTEYNQEIDLLYQKICDLVHNDETAMSGFAHGYLIELLYWVCSNSNKASQYPQNTSIQKILSIISDKQGVTTLNEISELLHMNKFYICHMFKSKTGRKLSDYLSDKIYDCAIEMLKGSTDSIEEIAFKCGFSAASSFTRFFKKRSGVSPSKFRKDKNNTFIVNDI